MANHREHLLIGAAAGIGVCGLTTLADKRSISLPEMLGAALSGALCAKLPDIIEPATSPHHRASFHSWSFVEVGLPIAWNWTQQKRQVQLRKALYYREQAGRTAGLPESEGYWLKSLLCEFAAGLLIGLVAGYASHLLADSLTPKGLPLA